MKDVELLASLSDWADFHLPSPDSTRKMLGESHRGSISARCSLGLARQGAARPY